MFETRRKVFEGTVEIVCKGWYTTEMQKVVNLDSIDSMCRGSVMYSEELNVSELKPFGSDTKIEVNNIDCLEEVVRLKKLGYNPALLNLANGYSPCAFAVYGNTQEESLFRRTSLFKSLCQFHTGYRNLSDYLNDNNVVIENRKQQYPMDDNFGCIYSPNVQLFRDNEKNGYRLLDNPESFGVISSAAICMPDLTPDNQLLTLDMMKITKNKIRTIFRVGLKHGHDSMVLGAFGCGAFGNPPAHVARLFHSVLEECEFKNKFRLITFAIIEDANSIHRNGGNFEPFKREFQ